MANSKDCSFLPPRILTRGILQLTILIVVALLGVFAISQPAVADLLAFENFQIPDKDNTSVNINGYGTGFGFSGNWSSNSASVKVYTTSTTDITLANNIPIKNVKTSTGHSVFLENAAGNWNTNNVTRNLSDGIDFSQPGEYYLCFNSVEKM